MKLCKDCHFFQERLASTDETRQQQHRSQFSYDGDCTHSIASPVNGAVLKEFMNGAKWARINGPCGWDAKWFEKKVSNG